MNKTIHIIAGPTASGKSALAMDIAAREDGVIVNADSMQVYTALPVLTAHPSMADRAAIPHELYGVLPPHAACSAGNWREMAEPVIARILKEGKTPVVVGGSGLYLKALIDGLSPIPDIPDDIRNRVIALQKTLGNPAFHDALKEKDPLMAARLHPYHTARLVRAYEVMEATNQSLARFQALPLLGPPLEWVFEVSLILPDRNVLNARCNARFVDMMENGAVEEAQALLKLLKNNEIPENALICRALGVRPLMDWIEGRISRDEAVEKGQLETRQYAKRQVTWFKNQMVPKKNIANIRVLP